METTVQPRKACTHYSVALLEQAREEFIAGHGSIKDISARLGIKRHVLERKSAGGLWSVERGNRQLSNRVNRRNGHALTSLMPLPIQEQPVSPQGIVDSGHAYLSQAPITEQHLVRLDQLISSELDPRRIAELIRARGDLLTQWRIILGIPDPNRAKSRRKADSNGPALRRQSQPQLQPLAQPDTKVLAVSQPESPTPRQEAPALTLQSGIPALRKLAEGQDSGNGVEAKESAT